MLDLDKAYFSEFSNKDLMHLIHSAQAEIQRRISTAPLVPYHVTISSCGWVRQIKRVVPANHWPLTILSDPAPKSGSLPEGSWLLSRIGSAWPSYLLLRVRAESKWTIDHEGQSICGDGVELVSKSGKPTPEEITKVIEANPKLVHLAGTNQLPIIKALQEEGLC